MLLGGNRARYRYPRTQAGFFVIDRKQHALGACRLQVVEATLEPQASSPSFYPVNGTLALWQLPLRQR